MATRRNCDSCGDAYTAKTARSRYCSDRCKVRYSRGVVVPIETKAKPSPPPAAGDDVRPQPAGVLGATIRELELAERLETPAGQAALVLAWRLDGNRDTGSAMATMTRQLRETLAEALKGARREGSKLDELTERRRQRLNRGA
jgi:hypothetical protein